MNFNPDYLVALYKVRKLYDDFDSSAGISEVEYVKLVDDLIFYDLQLKMRDEAEANLSTLTEFINGGQFTKKKTRQKVATIVDNISEKMENSDSKEYLENMINSLLARLAPYRKSRSTKILSTMDAAFIDMFYEFYTLEKCQQAAITGYEGMLNGC